MSTYPVAPSLASIGSCYDRGMPKKKQTRAVGRPTIFTGDVIRKLEEAFMIDATDGEACAFAGIGETASYDERKRNPESAERMERAKRFPTPLAKKMVIEAMKERRPEKAGKEGPKRVPCWRWEARKVRTVYVAVRWRLL
jgi:hypothetical protein